MKILDFAQPERGDGRLGRVAAVTFIGATAIAALYFGQEVLIPTAIAVLFAFILGPAVTVVRRLLPLPLAVAAVVLGALVVAGLVTMLIMSQLAEVAGSLTGYQANLHQKIQDIRHLSEGDGALSRFVSMVASLGRDLAVTAEPAAAPAVRVQSGSDFASVAAFVAPLMHPLLTIGIVVILVVFILLDRDHLSDQFVRLFGKSDVHATSEAIGDAANRVGRVLSLQLLTNFGFAVLVGGGLFALGMPNPVLWGLLAGALRFIPYVGAILGAVLPTLIAFAVTPGWMQPFLVLGWIVGGDLIIGQIVEPLLFGRIDRRHAASAHHVGDLLGHALGARRPAAVDTAHHLPAGAGHARAASRLPANPAGRRAGAGTLSADLPPSDPQGGGRCLNGGVGRDRGEGAREGAGRWHGPDGRTGRSRSRAGPSKRCSDRGHRRRHRRSLSLHRRMHDDDLPAPIAPTWRPREVNARFHCVGGRGQIDDAAAAIVAFALRQAGLEASTSRHSDKLSDGSREGSIADPPDLLRVASFASDTALYVAQGDRYGGGAGRARHVIIDYDVAPAPAPLIAGAAGPRDCFVGDLAALCRFAAQHAAAMVPPAIAQAVTEPRTTSQ